MDTSLAGRPPAWPRLIGAFGLIWNLYGVYQYLVTVGIAGPAADARHSMADAMPMWVTAAFAIAVFAGAIGSLCLALLNRWATGLLAVSLVADLLWDIRMLSGGDRNSAMVLVAMVTLIGIVLVWASVAANKRGWLR